MFIHCRLQRLSFPGACPVNCGRPLPQAAKKMLSFHVEQTWFPFRASIFECDDDDDDDDDAADDDEKNDDDDIDDDVDYGGGGGGGGDDDDDDYEEEAEHDDVARFGATFVFAFGAVWASKPCDYDHIEPHWSIMCN